LFVPRSTQQTKCNPYHYLKARLQSLFLEDFAFLRVSAPPWWVLFF
jgi:hypothetical protein